MRNLGVDLVVIDVRNLGGDLVVMLGTQAVLNRGDRVDDMHPTWHRVLRNAPLMTDVKMMATPERTDCLSNGKMLQHNSMSIMNQRQQH